jgi:hypothetical protein
MDAPCLDVPAYPVVQRITLNGGALFLYPRWPLAAEQAWG